MMWYNVFSLALSNHGMVACKCELVSSNVGALRFMLLEFLACSELHCQIGSSEINCDSV